MAYKLIDIEGIGKVAAAKLLETLDIKTVEELLELGASKKGRADVAAKSGIDESKILRWVNMADMFRIKGVAEEYSDLLEASGVDTVKELRNRVPANLLAKVTEVNAAKNLTNRTPNLTEIESWVAQAKEMEPMVTY
ncbi:MAG: DUF4332 domain-containing protein [Saprospiraceae bacterium]